MNELLTRNEIREICLEHGFSVRQQPSGPDDLNPYVYSAANALIERALKAALIIHQRGKYSALKLDPTCTLDIPQYESVCPQYDRDFRQLEALLDSLQASLVQRKVNSTKLWNMSVVDKHGALIYGVTSMRLGPAMHSLIDGIKKVVQQNTVKNEPFFPTDDIETKIDALKQLCDKHGFRHLLPIDPKVNSCVGMEGVTILGPTLIQSLDAALTVPGSPLYITLHPKVDEGGAIELGNLSGRLVDFGADKGAYYLIPVYDHYDTIRCGEWHDDWLAMKTISELLGVELTVTEEGKYTYIKVGDITFGSIFASSATRYANCYLGHLALAANGRERTHD